MPYPDFAIFATSPPPVNASQPFVSTITITALNGFAGTVSLTDVVPAGLSCGPIIPPAINGSGIATLSCSGLTPGNYTITITGTSGTLSHTVPFAVVVQSTSVGGIVLPVDKLRLIAQVLPATSIILIILIAGIGASLTRRKRRSESIRTGRGEEPRCSCL